MEAIRARIVRRGVQGHMNAGAREPWRHVQAEDIGIDVGGDHDDFPEHGEVPSGRSAARAVMARQNKPEDWVCCRSHGDG